MRLVLRAAGLLLLLAFGCGVGFALYLQKVRQWQQLHAFVQLLQYLLDGIRYGGSPCVELLRAAAAKESFAALGLQGCGSFCEIPVPSILQKRYGADLPETFRLLERAPLAGACAGLERAITLCGAADTEALAAANTAGRLYPKLGLCLGAMAAILLA